MSDEKNPFEGEGAPSKQDMLLAEAEKKSAEDLKNRKEGKVAKSSETKKTSKPKTPKAPKAPKAAKPKKEAKPKAPKKPKAAKKPSTSNRAPRQALSDKELAEPREIIRIRPAIIKKVERFAKLWEMETNEAAEKMLMTAVGRLNALSRYNEG